MRLLQPISLQYAALELVKYIIGTYLLALQGSYPIGLAKNHRMVLESEQGKPIQLPSKSEYELTVDYLLVFSNQMRNVVIQSGRALYGTAPNLDTTAENSLVCSGIRQCSAGVCGPDHGLVAAQVALQLLPLRRLPSLQPASDLFFIEL